VLRRAASDLLIVAAAFVTILLAATILAAGPIYANAVAASGLERTLADAPARDSGLQVSARIPLDDLDRTSARVERTLKDAFGDASAPVYRSAVSDSYELPAARGREQGSLAVFAFYDDLPANADLVGGRWPSAGASTEAVLSVGAARSLGLARGGSRSPSEGSTGLATRATRSGGAARSRRRAASESASRRSDHSWSIGTRSPASRAPRLKHAGARQLPGTSRWRAFPD
jgi:hypothetical protein